MKIKLIIGLLVILIYQSTIAQIKVFIPDTNFQNFLNTEFPTFMDASGDSLVADSAATLTDTLDCSGRNIVDLTGVEYFINITNLWCFNNQLTSLPDLSTNTALTELRCSDNQLTSLPDLSTNTALTEIWCQSNQLTSLPDLSTITTLFWLECSDNQLTSLPNLSTNTALTNLICDNNQLTSLPDLSTNTALSLFLCRYNQLDSLPDLSTNTALTFLYCNNNQLNSLPDLSANTALLDLGCSYNQLISLPDLSANTALEFLFCSENKLDFSDARELRIADTLSNLSTFVYTPQNPFGNRDSINLDMGDTLILSIISQDSALSYQWFKDDNIIADATDTLLIIPDVTEGDGGIYTCRSYGTALESPPMIHNPGISEFVSEPITVTIIPNTDIKNSDYSCNINVYPNPNSGIFNITIKNIQTENITLTIYNSLGQEVVYENFKNVKGIYNKKFDLRKYPAGIYYLQILFVNEVINKQIIIQKLNN